MPKAIISAGGTGGHILPALAIAKELQSLGWEIVYIGNRVGMEEGLASSNGLRFLPIHVQKLYRKLTWEHVKFPFLLLKSYMTAKKYLQDEKPDIFIGCGGFVSGPAGLAAKQLRIPIYLQEQNSYPGITTKYLAKYAKKVFIAYEDTIKYLPKVQTMNLGNPTNIDSEFKDRLPLDKYKLKSNTKKLLVLGGSQGSVIINRIIESALDELLARGVEVIWQTGKRNYLALKNRYINKEGLFVFAFTDKMNEMYNTADLVVARAGALTLSELQIKKIPSILIPLPSAAENHQFYNAKELSDKRLALMLEQKFLTKRTFLKAVDELLACHNEFKANFPDLSDKAGQLIADEIVKDFGVK